MSNFEENSLLHERYRISRTLGKGGMGMVYLAEDLTLKRPVAVKENFSLGDDSSSQFLQEAHLLADLHHPNLPRVTDYFIESPYQYLVMDFLPGDDLQSVLDRDGRQPIQNVLSWADQLGDALAYMHTQSPPVIHRDIKPANIKLRADGSAALVDFGIAKAAETAQKTAAGAMGFTPGFAPPEQAGGGRTGPFSDQYALSATLYNLLTGTRPVDSVKRVLEGGLLPRARELNPDIPDNVSDALQKAMALHSEDRFGSIRDFLSALHDISFRWSGNDKKTSMLSEGKKKKPAWFYPAIGLIGLLVVAILGVSAIAMFKLASQAEPTKIRIDTAVTVVENLQPSPSSGASQVVPTEQKSTQPVEAVPVNTLKPAATQSLIARGKWLVYSSNQEDGKTLQLWMMQIGLNNEGKPIAVSKRPLTHGAGDKTLPAWSPDGKFILYSAPSLDNAGTNKLDIWKISAEGTDPVNLTNRKGDDLYASWSPKGNLISFTNDGREDGILQLYFMDPSGENQQRISGDYEEYQGIWPPDMQTLFYVINASNTRYFYQRASITEYKTPQPYDTNQIFGRLGQVSDPAFSPDGKLLAYTRIKGRDRRIGVADYLSRGGVFTLLTKTGADYDPSWSADGKWIAFTSERDGLSQIYIMTSAGLIQTDVSQPAVIESNPAWQP